MFRHHFPSSSQYRQMLLIIRKGLRILLLRKWNLPIEDIRSCCQKLSVQYIPERMDSCNCSVKKSVYMNEWMAEAYPPKDASTVRKWVAACYSYLQIKLYTNLKNGQLQVLFWKKIYCLYKNLTLPIDHFNSSSSEKLQHHKRNLGL